MTEWEFAKETCQALSVTPRELTLEKAVGGLVRSIALYFLRSEPRLREFSGGPFGGRMSPELLISPRGRPTPKPRRHPEPDERCTEILCDHTQ